MNYLAHSVISLEIDEKTNKNTLYGNFTGDFYKGRIEKIDLQENLKSGIILHRLIDKISDRKENFLNEFLQEKFGIFKGIVSDMYVDHFLCKNFGNIFSGNPDFGNVKKVERKIIKNIEKYDKFFPNDFKNFFDWLKRERVLARYKNLDFLERVFLGMSKRVRKGEILRNAVCELKNNYEDFEEKSLKEFLFVKKETERQFGLVEDNKNT
ncbi:tRNA modification GTPase TrmE [Leptotrichia sp. oral taxon 498]|uniref:ACP phosphodiesterase n=1 Tax=Leptotrichia sp. oral taxon 498 TaxID=712368 RepID=UPI000B8C6FD9|nr:ACP phosphodiesterase [Leptotrichia sp. oral taxon 498]ASQ47947.1 tRNA modification GTPase TrmE [Leptotrichia sp. oral taxon 498]